MGESWNGGMRNGGMGNRGIEEMGELGNRFLYKQNRVW